MSKYENYDEISKSYDQTRTAVGIEVILGQIAALNKNPDDINILDAGCGTGNYAYEIAKHYPNIWCADFSVGMLNKCKSKLQSLGVSLKLIQCDMALLSFQKNTFDVIICNQSLHHLDEPNTKFKNLRLFIKNSAISLKTDGVILINTITHQQLQEGVWWGDLIKPAVDRMKLRFTTDNELSQILEEQGLEIVNRVVELDTIIQHKGYFDEDSLLNKNFRDGDSHFSLLDKNELEIMIREVTEMKKSGNLKRYILERDLLRKKIGQFTYFIIRKK